MSGLPHLAVLILAVVALGLAVVRLCREIFHFEGIRLGDRLHTRLYDRWAGTYDAGKREVQKDDAKALAGPLIGRLELRGANAPETLVLDVATGTGRLPAALLSDPRFAGRVIGLDASAGMLHEAGQKLAPFGSRFVLLRQKAQPLPFPDLAFVAVCCLEAVELLEDREAHYREFLRVLEPGGTLLVSRHTGEWGRKGAACPPETFAVHLRRAGFERVEIAPWWRDFDLVWAAKPVVCDAPARARRGITPA